MADVDKVKLPSGAVYDVGGGGGGGSVDPATSDPLMDGAVSVGTSVKYAREDHRHPSDTSRVPTSRTINGEALTSDITLDASDVGALPATVHIPPDMVILSYGHSTWQDFLSAYSTNSVVYCRASTNTNPATGNQNRLAFLAYVDNGTNPTQAEFQYYRSVATHTASQQGDQVYVYRLYSTNGGNWGVTVRNAFSTIDTGSGLSQSYASGTLTLSADVTSVNGQTGAVVLDANDVGALPDTVVVPTKTSDLTNDSGFVDAAGAAAAAPIQSVSVTQTVSTGTKIGEIAVNGSSTDLYAPSGGQSLQYVVDGTNNAVLINDVTNNTAGDYATAEGFVSTASGISSHSEGEHNTASGPAAHAEGSYTTASGSGAHAEGSLGSASGLYAHAEGYLTDASGDWSHAGGEGTIASGTAQTAIGKYNDDQPTFPFIIGDGVDANNRHNLFQIEPHGAVRANGTAPAIYLQNTTVTNKIGDDVPSANTAIGTGFFVVDKNANASGYSQVWRTSADDMYMSFAIRRKDASDNDIYNGFYLHINASGDPTVAFTNTNVRNAWVTALGLETVNMGNPTLASGIGATIAANTSCKKGRQVSINLRLTGATRSAGSQPICTLPSGFRPSAEAFCVILVNGVYRNGSVSTAGVITVYGGVAVSSVEIKIMSTFRTS